MVIRYIHKSYRGYLNECFKDYFQKYKETVLADMEGGAYNTCGGVFCDSGSYISGEYLPVAHVIQ